MQEIIVDEGKIKCLISGKFRKETPEEYVRQEFCRILLDVYKYPNADIVAIIDCPVESFLPSTDTKTSLDNCQYRIGCLYYIKLLKFCH